MKRDVLHVVYVASCVFVSVFLVALYARPRAAASSRTSSATVPVNVYRTTYVVEYKYLPVWEKYPVATCRAVEGKI